MSSKIIMHILEKYKKNISLLEENNVKSVKSTTLTESIETSDPDEFLEDIE